MYFLIKYVNHYGFIKMRSSLKLERSRRVPYSKLHHGKSTVIKKFFDLVWWVESFLATLTTQNTLCSLCVPALHLQRSKVHQDQNEPFTQNLKILKTRSLN